MLECNMNMHNKSHIKSQQASIHFLQRDKSHELMLMGTKYTNGYLIILH